MLIGGLMDISIDAADVLWPLLTFIIGFFVGGAVKKSGSGNGKGEEQQRLLTKDEGSAETSSPKAIEQHDKAKGAAKAEASDATKNAANDKTKDAAVGNDTAEAKANFVPASQAVAENIALISPLLDNLSKGITDGWEDVVKKIANSDLTSYWQKAVDCANPALLLTNLLSMWGIKEDKCDSFVCAEKHLSMYDTQDGTPLETGKKYKVVSTGWLLTQKHDDGHYEKKVVKKGIAAPF